MTGLQKFGIVALATLSMLLVGITLKHLVDFRSPTAIQNDAREAVGSMKEIDLDEWCYKGMVYVTRMPGDGRGISPKVTKDGFEECK